MRLSRPHPATPGLAAVLAYAAACALVGRSDRCPHPHDRALLVLAALLLALAVTATAAAALRRGSARLGASAQAATCLALAAPALFAIWFYVTFCIVF